MRGHIAEVRLYFKQQRSRETNEERSAERVRGSCAARARLVRGSCAARARLEFGIHSHVSSHYISSRVLVHRILFHHNMIPLVLVKYPIHFLSTSTI